MHDGMKFSLAQTQVSFRHNNVESLRERLVEIQNSQPLIRQGQRCVLIAVETVYSMDGDVAPLEEFVEVAKEIFPKGNAQFIVDEAHSTGLMGRQGSGLVCALGLEKDIAIRMHTYGKGMGTTGGEYHQELHYSYHCEKLTDALDSCDTVQRDCQNNDREFCTAHHLYDSSIFPNACCNPCGLYSYANRAN